MNDLNTTNSVTETNLKDMWLELKAELIVELERLRNNPELLFFGGALSRLEQLESTISRLPWAKSTSTEDPVQTTTEHIVPAVLAMPSRVHRAPRGDTLAVSDGIRVLVGLASDIDDEMRKLDAAGATLSRRVDALEGWMGKAEELSLLEPEHRAALLHSMVSFVLMSQERQDSPALDKRISSCFRELVRNTSLRARPHGELIYIHGLKRDAKPKHSASWREEWTHSLKVFSGYVAVEQSTYQARSPRPRTRRRQSGRVESTLADVLEALQKEHPTRVVVLGDAMKSAHEAHDFRSVGAAQDLLSRLVTDYLDAFLDQGDVVAKTVFTLSQYAASESDTTQQSTRAMASRTFDYDGRTIVCLKHLCIGNGSDTRTGWRCYFEVDIARRRLVIGHCGKHLPLS